MQELRVRIVQFTPTGDAENNREQLRHLLGDSNTADVVVLPEYASFYDSDKSTWADGAEALDGPFVEFLVGMALATKTTIFAGLLEKSGDNIYNTVVAVGADGLLGRYRKVHLYDAFGARESAVLSAGDPTDEPVIVEINGWRLGIQTCYDLRFPEVSRRLVDEGATVLVVPSDWVPGVNKLEHWRTLLAARAIENLAWAVAADHPEPTGIGHSMVIDPLGVTVREAGSAPETLDVTLNPEVVASARTANPSLELRRYRVVPR